MIISDRIVVMNRGRIEQEGDARTLYTRPASAFVATFLGVANLLPGRLQAGAVHTSEGLFQVAAPPSAQDAVSLSIRPEDIVLHRSPPSNGVNLLTGRVAEIGELTNHAMTVK